MWELKVHARTGHSSGIFSEGMGDGAIYELSRILNVFHDTLREPNLTYNVGMVLGGSNIKKDANGDASVTGKVNIVPGEAVAIGDIRALSSEQLARVKDKMQSALANGLPKTKAEITFADKYPPMAPTPGNIALLAKLNEANRALGVPRWKLSTRCSAARAIRPSSLPMWIRYPASAPTATAHTLPARQWISRACPCRPSAPPSSSTA
jgi:Acetylornithine deacetylase/Succinyl-diaminopimelate desuccinylase and related deacylases